MRVRVREAAAVVLLLEALAACSATSANSCRHPGSSKVLKVGESTVVTVERSRNVWTELDIDGHYWNLQAVAPNDVPNGSYRAVVTMKQLSLEVVLPGRDPVIIPALVCM